MLKRILDRPITVTMALLVIVVLGIVSIKFLPVSLMPEINIPYITVQISAPNLSARQIDESVVKVLKQQLIQIQSLEDIQTESKDGSGSIQLSFRQGENVDYLFIEVNEKIDRSMGSLQGIDRPKVLKSSATDIPAFYINMTLREESSLNEETDKELFPVSRQFSDMSDFASEVVSKRIEQLSEVAMVDISGCVNSEILIILDDEALRQAGITETEFEDQIKDADIQLGSLVIRDGEYRFNVKFQSFVSNKEDIENIYFNTNGRLYQIKDIARVIEHPSKRSGLVRSSGKDAVTMAVIKQSDAKMAALKRSISTLMNQFEQDYPEVEFELIRDQTELLEYSINNLVINIIVGILLACIVIFLFMQDFRSPSLVAFTIPVALIFSILIFYIIGLTINIISLSGLILGVGMMVDNTIVLIDNITARWQRTGDLRESVLEGTSEVVAPMLSSVLTTCAVFIPLIFMSGIAGAMFYDQAMAVTVVLLTAYVVTVTVIPVYYWWWYKGFSEFRPSPLLQRFSFDKIIGPYESALQWSLRHRWVGWSCFILSAVGIVFCFIYMPKEKLPEIRYTDAIVEIEWNDQLSLEQNSARVTEIEAVAQEYVLQYTSLVGMQQFVLSHSGDLSVSEALLYFKCSDASKLEELQAVIAGYINSNYPGAVYGFRASGNIFDMVFADNEAEMVARLRPVSTSELNTGLLRGITSKIRENFPSMYIPQIELKKDMVYVADPQRLALYEVSYSDLVAVLKNALNENDLFSIVQGSVTLPVVMGMDTRNVHSIIEESFIRKNEKEIPVNVLMKQTYEEDLKSIISGAEGNFYPLNMELSHYDAEKVMSDIREIVREDGNFEVSFSGSYFSNRKMIGELLVVLLIALLLLYLILASQFESLLQPLIILSEIVIDLFGALLLLWICGATINLMSMIGLIVVCGIVINDSILKIDTINRLRKEGFALRDAITEAGQRRLKAIVMTSLTTIFSVVPFLSRTSMGDDLQYPMSIVIIAGMVVGTTISLFFIPLVYYEIYKRLDRKGHKS